MDDPDRDLEAVRDRIRELDGELVALAAERVLLGRRAGELKRRAGLAVVDYAQERRVLERAAARRPPPAASSRRWPPSCWPA